ncbi:hypothetical protein Rhe02_33930 [Rhizocola hellebori]|uniref:Uncharacterized protein n=1 Tax=Rhizocola hellebori TaxID=1392758 RepID=A0A8J3Q7L5_9ACTN|nr:hypothetical protein [Rhizocola hellebori]GIH05326.1 hypothetical protein Rhe02_33930 [Rhizocola hellebori]
MDGEDTAAAESLAELIITDVVPEEQELFGVISDAYRRDPGRFTGDPKERDEMLGFGVEAAAALLTPVVLAAAAEVVKYLAETGFRGLFRRNRAQQPEELSAGQLAHVRQIVLSKCGQAGVDDERSALVADGVLGALSRNG